jgi:hypothetical protein
VDVLVAAGVPGVEGCADEVCTATASSVARLKSSRCSGSSAVPRRTHRGGWWLRLGDGLVDLVHKNPPNRVSEMRKGERKVLGLEGVLGSHQCAEFRRRQWRKSAAAASNSCSLAAPHREGDGRGRRGGRGLYRSGLDGQLNRE